MGILRLEHNEGVKRIAELLYEEKLIPIFGSGFTKGAISQNGKVPDGKIAIELMQEIIAEFKSINLTNSDFNKTANRFFSIVPKKRQWEFFEKYFTNVHIAGYLRDFLALPWPYIYTLNVDDGIENTQLYTPVFPYHDTNPPTTSIKLLYKLHGDAKHEVLYKVEQNIVFSVKQYIEFLTSPQNSMMLNAISSDYKQKNLLFIGCSLVNEYDLQYIYTHTKEDISPNMLRCVLRKENLNDEEELDLNEYGINSVILVRDYELFYREVIFEFNRLKAIETSDIYQFTNPRHIYIKHEEREENIKYFSGENIFREFDNSFYKSQLHIIRTCVQEIESQLENHNSVIIRGRRFSGKTFILSSLAERLQKYTVLYFPSETTIDEDVLINLLNNRRNSIFLFDSNSLTNYSYHQVANSERILTDNRNKLIVAINSNDLYLSDSLKAESVLIPPVFNEKELKMLKLISDSFGLICRKERETNIDYLKNLADQQKIIFPFFSKMPTEFTSEETVLLILLSIKDKIYFSDISALDVRYRTVDQLIDRMQGIIEKVPVVKGEKHRHSTEKLVHNSKYYLLSIMKNFSPEQIIDSILYIVSHFVKDPLRKRLYVEAVLFDTLNQLFGYSKGAGKLIFDIYDALATYLSHDMDYWLQRAKSIYRLRPESYNDLINAYQYAKKALEDGNAHLKAKASLSTSLICCLLAKQCADPQDIDNYEREAIICADNAISSSYFSNRGNLKGELRIGYRQSYSQLIRNVCDKHLNDSESLHFMWQVMNIKRKLDELEQEKLK
ncbi:MAG: hypothetical protein HFG26_09175 [Provencibacterium sp.]|nr:hypothetical protein [Provencibacterium sp.]